jgi:hypothetical protein
MDCIIFVPGVGNMVGTWVVVFSRANALAYYEKAIYYNPKMFCNFCHRILSLPMSISHTGIEAKKLFSLALKRWKIG